jgi:hypothetical protein
MTYAIINNRLSKVEKVRASAETLRQRGDLAGWVTLTLSANDNERGVFKALREIHPETY